MSFQIGQRVVCICDDWQPSPALFGFAYPIRARVYTIRGFDPHIDAPFIWLEEIVNPCDGFFEPSWSVVCFRPVIERKTSIASFTSLLTPSKPKQLIDA